MQRCSRWLTEGQDMHEPLEVNCLLLRVSYKAYLSNAVVQRVIWGCFPFSKLKHPQILSSKASKALTKLKTEQSLQNQHGCIPILQRQGFGFPKEVNQNQWMPFNFFLTNAMKYASLSGRKGWGEKALSFPWHCHFSILLSYLQFPTWNQDYRSLLYFCI